jgi:hypothetical protein
MERWHDVPLNDLRWDDLCTKEATGQCALCDVLAERERFEQRWFKGGGFYEVKNAVVPSLKKGLSWLRAHAPLALNCVTRFADRRFFDEDAFTFKGVMTFVLQMLGVLGIIIAAQLFAHPASVRARNFEPVGCLDINQYEEHFALMGVDDRKKFDLREIIDRFVNKPEDEKVNGPMHHITCWYVTPRSARREQEVRELAFDMRRTGHPFRSGSEYVRRLALGTAPFVQLDREWELSPSNALRFIPFAPDAIYLDVKVIMKPSNQKSIYTEHSRWEGRISYKNIVGIQEVVEAIEHSALQGQERDWALEIIDAARWFINRVELKNLSSHAIAQKTTLSINQRGLSSAEFLSGSGPLEFTQRGGSFLVHVEKILPGEQLWGVIRTKKPIGDSQLQVISDPTLVFDRESLKKFLKWYGLVLIPLFFLWWLGNWHTRKVQKDFQK